MVIIMSNNNTSYKSAYGVGDGKLYIASGRLTEKQLRREEYLAGESEGGCRLVYSAKSFPIKDIHGKVVTVLRYGEKTVISGRLRRLDVGVLAAKSVEKPQIARVVAVGPGGEVDGKEIKMYLKEGDRVISAKYSGTEVKVDGEEYTIVKQSDILAVVE